MWIQQLRCVVVFINALCTTSRASREPGNQQINEINAVTP
jgi:hypothetical protein